MSRRTTAFLAAVSVAGTLCLATPVLRGAPAGEGDVWRGEIVPLILRIAQPLFAPPEAGKAWVFEGNARWDDKTIAVTLAWDGGGQHALRLDAPFIGRLEAAVRRDGSWLHVPEHGVLFSGKRDAPAAESPLAACRVWKILKQAAAAGAMAVRAGPMPVNLRVEKKKDGVYRFLEKGGGWKARLAGSAAGGGPIHLRYRGAADVRVAIDRVAQVPAAELARLLEPPSGVQRREEVDDEDLRWMLTSTADLLSEKALWATQPRLVPSLVPASLNVDGHPVLVVRGSPEEMGRQYGERLKEASLNNMHRVLHAIGLVDTVRSGVWFARTLRETWAKQRKYVPERFIREMDALADAVGAPRERVYWTNVFPERFHCSGLALRGAATEGGRLLHGRILDYMTEVGFQATAVITVRVPDTGFAWLDVGYAGCVGTVTAMNARGLAMGEMGGRGEGHVDGLPMTFLMREVMERFDTTKAAVDWIRSVPRTCEYYYVVSDAKTRQMAGLASWARSLAAEKKTGDLLVLHPGDSHELLPHGMPDTVLMSGGGRYERLVERVKASYGKITPEVAWKIMGEGVAMKSALHIALFQPESLDVWVARAGLDASPAYTQPISKLNLKKLLEGAPRP